MPIKVFIVEDHFVTRRGIRLVLEEDDAIVVVGEAETGQEALAQILALQPDVVVCDYELLQDMTGADLILALQQADSHASILILSGYDDSAYVRAAVTAGAKGYMLKDEYGPDIIAAVKMVAQGGTYFSPAIVPMLAAITKTSVLHFTEQEEQVLRLVAKGNTNLEIAQALEVEIRTVRFHLANLFEKLGVSNRGKVAAWAWKHGFGGK